MVLVQNQTAPRCFDAVVSDVVAVAVEAFVAALAAAAKVADMACVGLPVAARPAAGRVQNGAYIAAVVWDCADAAVDAVAALEGRTDFAFVA